MFPMRIAGLALVLLIAGCGLTPTQKQQVKQFATTAETVALNTQNGFKNTRDRVIELETMGLALNHRPVSHVDVDGGLSIDGITIQINALAALQAYAKVLNQLVSFDSMADVAGAATEFATQYDAATKAINVNYSLSDAQKQSIAGLITMTGSLFVEYKKKKHIKAFIALYGPDIEKLAVLLKHDLTLKGDSLCLSEVLDEAKGKTGVIDHYCTSAKKLRRLAIGILNTETLNYADRERVIAALIESEKAIIEVRELSQRGEAAIAGLIVANGHLSKVIDDSRYTTNDIKVFAKQVGQLKTMLKVLSN